MDPNHEYPAPPEWESRISRLRVPDVEEGLPLVLDPNTGEWVNPLFVGRGMGGAGRRGFNAQSSKPENPDQINKPTLANSGPPGCLDICSIGLGKRRFQFEVPPPAKHTDFYGRNRELFRFKVVEKWPNPVESRAMRVDLSALQTLTIRRLQSKLVREALEHRYRPEDDQDPEWLGPNADYQSSTMRQYVAALQDHECMARQVLTRNGNDPFRVSSASALGFTLLEEHLEFIMESEPAIDPSTSRTDQGNPLFSARSDLEYLRWVGKPKRDLSQRETAPFRMVMTVNDVKILGFLRRFGAGLAMSMFLVAPMVIIIFVPHLDQGRASAVAASFTFVFAMAAAFMLKEIVGVVSATAAYAAVLVVFVAEQQKSLP